ncbi:MAG TPA: EAL domain-containing protein, partial [Candidatus Caenarcaniphilales bacterium]
LDRFKLVNDSLGHLAGDQLLRAIARRLEMCLRPGDTVARLGGDEFTILLEDIKDPTTATAVAARIQEELGLPFTLDGHEVYAGASIGISLSTTGYHNSEDMLRDADIAMYRAKIQGAARHAVFDQSMHTHTLARLQLETDLRRAIAREELRLHYQPIVSLGTGQILAFEALVRWQHPQRGLIPPSEFITIAEETGLIVPLGQWVLYEACHQARAWHRQFPEFSSMAVSVNLSSKQFLQPELVQQIVTVLQETGLDACRLKLEITESCLMENAEFVTAKLWQLQALDIQLCMDDFGTGYSSLSYLHRFPIHLLKIDRSFINSLQAGGENLEIVRAIVTLAANLGLEVIAEGLETAEQLRQLRVLKCQQGQGYFFSQPLDSRGAKALIAAQPR